MLFLQGQVVKVLDSLNLLGRVEGQILTKVLKALRSFEASNFLPVDTVKHLKRVETRVLTIFFRKYYNL
jgi:hypothetical protein